MRRAGVAVVLCVLPGVYAACDQGAISDGAADAGLQDVGAPETSTPPGADGASDAAAPPPDTGPPSDAATPDSSPSDASADSSTADAASDSGASDSGASDSGASDSGADAAPPVLPAATTIDTDVDLYDANDTHVIYRKVPAGVSLRYCESRACATPHQVGVSTYNAGKDYFAASTTKFYIFKDHQNFQASLHSFLPTAFPPVTTQEHNLGGWSGRIFVSSYSVSRSLIAVTYTKTPILGAPTTASGRTTIVTDQVPMTGGAHWNFGSDASLGAGAIAPTVTGATLPALATPAARIGTSARGPTVPYPTAVILRDGNLEACPTAGDCAAWLNLGPLGDTFNLDDTNLYVGGPTGLGRCALSEIATLGTCTLTPLVVGEPISSRVILTPSQVWFLTGGTLKFLEK
ncbi:MAG TPA: hypothetical protein PLR99_03410 [Polyangiaceae bacterium]|nr:hypothetical protein [Polyangiaceae bacterium]